MKMDLFNEDHLEEVEFRSMSTFEQQRYTRKLQDMDECFKEVQKQLKNKSENSKEFLDILALENHKDHFDDQMIIKYLHGIRNI